MSFSALADSRSRRGIVRRGLRQQSARWGLPLAVIFGLVAPGPAPAIEMFTFFGDGSRVPLPSLETPIEAYPGIPLRSDRLRARRRARHAGPDTEVRVGPPGGMSIRIMPQLSVAPDPDTVLAPPPVVEPVAPPPPSRPRLRRWRR